MTGAARRGLAALALVVAGVAGAALLGEAVARLAGPALGLDDLFASRVRAFADALVVPDDDLGVRLRPGAEATVAGVRYRVSSLGTRGPEPRPRPAGSVPRDRTWGRGAARSRPEPRPRPAGSVLLLGDSVAMGWGVPEEDTFASRLAADLDADVVNAAVLGYGTVQEARLLDRLGPRLRPDLVLVAYYPNDPDTSSGGGPTWSALWRLVRPRLRASLIRLGLAPDAVAHHRALHAPDSATWARTAEALVSIAARCRSLASRCGVVLLPTLVGPPDALDAEYARVADTAHALGLPTLDLRPAIAHLDPRALWVAPDDPHPDARGHAAYADAIAPWIRDQGLLPRPASAQ